MELILILPSMLYLVWRVHVSVKHEAPLPRETSVFLFVILMLLTRLVTTNVHISNTAGIVIVLAEALLSGALLSQGERVYARWIEKQKNKDNNK